MKTLTVALLLITNFCFGQNKAADEQIIYQFVKNHLKERGGEVLEKETYKCLGCIDEDCEKKVIKDLKKRFSRRDFKHLMRQYKDTTQFKWNQDSLPNVKVISNTTIKEVLGDRNDWNKWQQFKKQYGKALFSINKPLFTLDRQYMLVNVGRQCSDDCFHQALFIYKKENGVWKEVDLLCSIIA